MFENLKMRYEKNWCRIDQLAVYVRLNLITPEEFKEICGEDYETYVQQ